jgi:hypothetical protein
MVIGTGFLAGGGTAQDVAITFLRTNGSQSVELPVTQILSVESTRVRFKVPDSLLRSPPRQSTPADIKVTAHAGTRTLVGAYSFEFPRVTGSDITSGRSSGGQLMVVQGAGLPPTSTVDFVVAQVASPFAAQVTSVSADGTRLFLVTPDMRGQERKKADVTVKVPGFDPLVLPVKFDILPESSGPSLQLTSVSPSTGTICGGLEVTLKGEGFLPGLKVFFGSLEAAEVTVQGGQTALVIVPEAPEGTGAVSIKLRNTDDASVDKPGAFTYKHPAPQFKRGDVDESGAVEFADALLLSRIALGDAAKLPANLDAADANDDGSLDGGDVTTVLNHLFGGLNSLPPPFTTAGFDPTPDSITSCGVTP